MTQLPKLGNASEEHRGLAILKEIVASAPPEGLGHVFRELSVLDFGIDAQIEIVDRTGDEALVTGKILSAQVKAGKSYFQNESDAGWVNYIPQSTVEYWRSHSVPVIFVLVDLDTRQAYWVRGDSDEHERLEKSFKILVPRTNRLDLTAALQLRDLAEDSTEEDGQRALLDGVVPLMAAAERGEHLCVELTTWANKSSGRTDFWLGVSGSRAPGTDGPSDIRTYASGSVYGVPSLLGAAQVLAPWADAGRDDDFEDQQRSLLYDVYLAERGTYDSESGRMVDSTGTFERWLDRRRFSQDERFIAYEDNGEYLSYRLALELNELGRAYLKVKSFLLGQTPIPTWPPA